jgi:hypothetical protein
MWQTSSNVFLISSLCFVVLSICKNDTTSPDNCGLSFSEYQKKKNHQLQQPLRKKDGRWVGLNMNAREGKVYLTNLASLLLWQLERVKAIPRVKKRN